ncbi:gamma-glutamyltransferase [Agrobacterium fabrum]|uniref:gamma-glutamyltransferase n=1 Tax=Agrobacterium fabrum TaxID=1176649 RepID=UPI001F3E5B16|nr:gamma-glutamyltransferase [Agrobacterium fabrum]
MAVSLTHTAANHFGSKVVCPRTGLIFDGAMGWFNACPNAANSIEGGKRPLANMAPLLVTKGGQVVAAIGAPGGRRIINATLQLIINLIEKKMNAVDAVHAPRIDASGTTLLASERLKEAVEATGLNSYGYVNGEFEPYTYEMARPVVVVREQDGRLVAITDPTTKGYSSAI